MATLKSSARVTSKQALLEAYAESGSPLWKLRDLEGNQLADYGSADPDGATVEEGGEALVKALSRFADGRMFLEMRETPGPKGAQKGFFRIMLDMGAASAGFGVISGTGGGVDWQQKYMEEKIAGVYKDFELQKVQEEKTSVIDRLLENPAVIQVIGLFAGKLLGGVVPMGGSVSEAPISGVDDEQRLNNALHTIAQTVPNYIEVLEKLAKMCAENPQKVNQLLSFL